MTIPSFEGELEEFQRRARSIVEDKLEQDMLRRNEGMEDSV